jgi:hypothetical protein
MIPQKAAILTKYDDFFVSLETGPDSVSSDIFLSEAKNPILSDPNPSIPKIALSIGIYKLIKIATIKSINPQIIGTCLFVCLYVLIKFFSRRVKNS